MRHLAHHIRKAFARSKAMIGSLLSPSKRRLSALLRFHLKLEGYNFSGKRTIRFFQGKKSSSMLGKFHFQPLCFCPSKCPR